MEMDEQENIVCMYVISGNPCEQCGVFVWCIKHIRTAYAVANGIHNLVTNEYVLIQSTMAWIAKLPYNFAFHCGVKETDNTTDTHTHPPQQPTDTIQYNIHIHNIIFIYTILIEYLPMFNVSIIMQNNSVTKFIFK